MEFANLLEIHLGHMAMVVKGLKYSGYWISIVLGMKMLCSALKIILKHGFNTAPQSLKYILGFSSQYRVGRPKKQRYSMYIV